MKKRTKDMTATKVLDWMASCPNGACYSAIQYAAWFCGHQGKKPLPPGPCPRGWWCDALSGSRYGGPGLLHLFCAKDPVTGRWVRNDLAIDADGPWKQLARARANGLKHPVWSR